MILKHASMKDAKFLYNLRLDPTAIKFQGNTNTFSFTSHSKWLSTALKDKNRIIFIAFVEKHKIGMVRFDIKGNSAIISVAIPPEFRGKGFGIELILAGCKRFFSFKKINEVRAIADIRNSASINAFTKSGFKVKRKFSEKKRQFIEMHATLQDLLFDCAIVGFGSIGQRHATNLSHLGKRPIIYDASESQLQKAREMGYAVTHLFEDVLHLAQSIVICSPPLLHIPQAVTSLFFSKPAFIEKPLSTNTSRISRLFLTAKRNRVGFFVGCNLRFTQGLQMVKALLDKKAIGKVVGAEVNFGYYLPSWRPGTDYRKNYAASRKAGGGVMLDAIHEIDYAIYLFGIPKELFAVYGKKSDLEIETEDFAEIFGSFGQTPVHIHLDYLNKKYTRYCKIIGERGAVLWNFADKTLTLTQGRKKKVIKLKHDVDVNNMYVDEMNFFIRNMRNAEALISSSLVSAESMYVVEAAKKSNGLKVAKVKQLHG